MYKNIRLSFMKSAWYKAREENFEKRESKQKHFNKTFSKKLHFLHFLPTYYDCLLKVNIFNLDKRYNKIHSDNN